MPQIISHATGNAVLDDSYKAVTSGVDPTGTEQALQVDALGNLKTTQGLGAKVGSAVSVTTTATLLIAANPARKGLVITNNGTVTVFLGLSGVTTANGIPLVAGATLQDSSSSDAWYGIVASGTADVRVLEAS